TSGAHTSLRRINLPNGNTAQGGITKQYDYRRAEPISPAGNGAPKGNAVTLRRTLGRCPLYKVTGRNARTKSGGVSPWSQLLHPRVAIVVGHAAERIDHAAANENVRLGPMYLEIAPCDWRKEDAAFEPSEFVHQRDAIPIAQMQRGGVLGAHENRIASGANQRVDFAVDERVELLATPRADFERAFRPAQVRQRDGAEVRLAIRRVELAVGAQVRSAVLKSVARLLQPLDAVVERHYLGNFLANGLAGLALQQLRPLRPRCRGQLEQDAPFGTRLAHLPRYLRAERDAPFRNGLGAAAVLLVTRLGRKENHFLARLDEHLVGENDVLVHTQRDVAQSRRDVIRLRQRPQKISTEAIEHVQFSARAGFDHLGGREAIPIRH